MRYLKCCFALIATVALVGGSSCTEANPAASSNNGGNNGGWLDRDAQADDAVDGATPQDDTGSEDAASANNGAGGDASVVPTDAAADSDDPTDAAADTGEPDSGGTLGQSCETNSGCDSGQVCCASDWEGNAECTLEEECRFGGYCESSDECADGEGCCERFGAMMCSTRCEGETPGSGDPCTTNEDCTNDEICCSDRNSTFCTTRDSCWTGGICEADDHCLSGETCCELGGNRANRCVEDRYCF